LIYLLSRSLSRISARRHALRHLLDRVPGGDVPHLVNETRAEEADLRHAAEAGSADIEARRRTFGVRGMDALIEIRTPSLRGVAVPI